MSAVRDSFGAGARSPQQQLRRSQGCGRDSAGRVAQRRCQGAHRSQEIEVTKKTAEGLVSDLNLKQQIGFNSIAACSSMREAANGFRTQKFHRPCSTTPARTPSSKVPVYSTTALPVLVLGPQSLRRDVVAVLHRRWPAAALLPQTQCIFVTFLGFRLTVLGFHRQS